MAKWSSRPLDTRRRAFKSIKTWYIYQAFGDNCVKVSSFIMVACVWCFFNLEDFKIVFPSIVIFLIAFLLTTFVVLNIGSDKERLVESHLALITAELQKSRPGVSDEAWDQVALNLNSLFCQTKVWRSPYFFYDGRNCRSYFRKFYLVPFNSTTHNSTRPGDLEKGPNVVEKTDEETAKRQCVVEYKDSMRLLFNEFVAQESVPISSEFSVLPKERYTKFYFNIRCLISALSLYIYSQEINLFFMAQTVMPLWASLLMILCFFLLGVWPVYYEYCSKKFVKLSVSDRIRILAEVMRTKPKHSDVQAWESLAKGTNQWLRAKGTWKQSDEFFYDGREYENLYHHIVSDTWETYVELKALYQEVVTAVRDS